MPRNIFHKMTSHIKDDQGIAFVTVLVVSTVLSLSAAAYFAQSSQEAGTVMTRIDSTQALYAAEAAVEWAKYQLTDENEWYDWESNVDTPGVDTPIQVEFSYDEAINLGTIIATSLDATGTPLRKIKVEVGKQGGSEPQTKTTFAKAVCGCDGVSIRGNADVDSYNSSEGNYSWANRGYNGHVGSNVGVRLGGNADVYGSVELLGDYSANGNAEVYGNVTAGGNYRGNSNSRVRRVDGAGGNVYANGDMRLGANSRVYEDAHIGGDITFSANARIMGNTYVGGSVNKPWRVNGDIYGSDGPFTFDEDVCPCDNELDLNAAIEYAKVNNDNDQIDARYLNGTKFSIRRNDNYTIPEGVYYFTKFKVSGNADVNIDGEVVIYLDADSKVQLSGNADVNMNINIDNDSDNAPNLRLYTNTTKKVHIAGNADFSGTIYAPYCSDATTGNAEIFGAIVARKVNLAGNGKIHYDEDAVVKEDLPVAGSNLGGEVTVNVVSWRELDPFAN